jgi:hypothetical protein
VGIDTFSKVKVLKTSEKLCADIIETEICPIFFTVGTLTTDSLNVTIDL